MKSDKWMVDIISQAKKSPNILPEKITVLFRLLLEELSNLGPYRTNWPNYTKMNNKDDYHCHIKNGKPTYVVCWRISNKKDKIIEVYYAGTHEKAPY